MTTTASDCGPTPLPRFFRCLFFAFASAALLLVAACGEEEEQAGEQPAEPAPQAEAPEPKPEPEVPEPPAIRFERVAFGDLPGWSEDPLFEALPALRRSCARMSGLADDRLVGPDGVAGTIADWRAPCTEIQGLPDESPALRALLLDGFSALRVVGVDGPDGKITGYYEPELRGATTQDEAFRWPLYGLPDDQVRVDLGRFDPELEGKHIVGRVGDDNRLVPYFTRAEIDDGALAGRGLELLWLDDPSDVFFLHIQGSGRIGLPDGSFQRVGFAGSNGLAYTSIGRYMLDQELIGRDQASSQGIQAWLRANPEQATTVMQKNARFIFFRALDGEGPIGAQGVALTPGRSLAVDTAHLPLGAPVWLDTTWPGSDRPLRRLVVAQDKGAAIKGAVRGDLFWGSGAAALEEAGRMNQVGRFFLLLPRTVAERLHPET